MVSKPPVPGGACDRLVGAGLVTAILHFALPPLVIGKARLGSALGDLGLVKMQAKPCYKAQARLGSARAQAEACVPHKERDPI